MIGLLSFEFPQFDAGVVVAVCLEEQLVVEDDQIRRTVVACRVHVADEFRGGAVEFPQLDPFPVVADGAAPSKMPCETYPVCWNCVPFRVSG